MHPRRILHASDFSRVSTAAFRHAVALAREHHATLILVHAVSESMPLLATPEIGVVSAPVTYRMIRASALREAKASLDRLVDAARGAGVRARARVIEGVAHQRIVQLARRERVDLIVMGTHGRSGLSRLFLGSVAARVAALAPCPVVTIRAGAGGRSRTATRVAGMALALVLIGTIAEAQRPNLSDIALCNEQAQAKAGRPSASPRTVTPRPGTRTDPSGSIIVQSPDPLLEGMATDGLDDPAYRTAYRDCMAGRVPERR